MKDQKTNKLIKISLLSAIAFLLYFISLPIPIFPAFLKIDISDIPALIGALSFGPVVGVVIEFVKNLLHCVFGSDTVFIGEAANFLFGSIMVFAAGWIYQRRKSKKSVFIGLAVGTVLMSIAAGVFNYYVFFPLYEKLLHFPISAMVAAGKKINPSVNSFEALILWSVIPFNLIKGFVVTLVTAGVYNGIYPIVRKEAVEYKQHKQAV